MSTWGRRVEAVLTTVVGVTALTGLVAVVAHLLGADLLHAWGIAEAVAGAVAAMTAGGYADRFNAVSMSSVLSGYVHTSKRPELSTAELTELGVAVLVGGPLFAIGIALLTA